MSDSRQSPPPSPGSNNTIIFIVGALVVAVGVLAYVFTMDSTPPSGGDAGGSAPAVSIENNTTSTAPAATAPEAPAVVAPAEPAPEAMAPEPAAPAPAEPATNP